MQAKPIWTDDQDNAFVSLSRRTDASGAEYVRIEAGNRACSTTVPVPVAALPALIRALEQLVEGR